MNNLVLRIFHGDHIYEPPTEAGISWETSKKGMPGKLTFSLVSGDVPIEEGDAVTLTVDGKGRFYGFVFTLSQNESGKIQITAYDQLRYLKNKDCYTYQNKTASEVLQMIARDFSLKTGEIVNTAYRIPYRIEDGKTLFDIIESALDITLQQTGKRYVLYDDFGKLTLQSTETMTVPIWIDETAGEGLSFSSSIDRETYNKIKFLHEDGRKGVRNIYQKEDRTTQKKWGILQHFSHISGEVNGSQEASSTLRLSNKKARTLSLSKVCGDVRVRAGSTLSVKLTFGQEKVEQKMTVASVRHLFSAEEHRMDLTLEGGSFDG